MSKKRNDTLIIIPVFNEERNISKVVDELLKNFPCMDVLVVNDGSFDNTVNVLRNKNIFLINHPFNMGIGASIETACKFALMHDYSYIIRMDGDGQHNFKYIEDMVLPVRSNKADITIGSRFLGNSEFKSSPVRLIGIAVITFVLRVITKKKITDPTSGFCAMNKKAFGFFSENCAEDYPEPGILIHHANFRIMEVPVSITRRNEGISSITPLKSIYYMFKVLLSLFVNVAKEIK